MRPSVSVIVPTRGRPAYLEVALASLTPQAQDILVVEDGPPGRSRELAERHGARYLALGRKRGLNAARNAGLHATDGQLVVFVDDDVRVASGWLDALRAAAAREPAVDIFTGPIHASFERRGRGLALCGREGPPITAMDLGESDRLAPYAWGANMAIRRSAFERVGRFDATLSGGGDEQEWQERHGGPIRYVAGAAIEHRRTGGDARLPALMRGAFRRGAELREFDSMRGKAPPLRGELRVLIGCVWHTARRRCANGPVMAAHSLGRAWGARAEPRGLTAGEDFLSGESGTVGGRRDMLRDGADAALDVMLRLNRFNSSAGEQREVLVLSIVREDNAETFARARAELLRSRHRVRIARCSPGPRGKFENLNVLLAEHPPGGADWLLVLDDDVELPSAFLDRFLALCEHFELRLAQPAHRRRSHAAWRLTRRRAGALVRETRFVEIGPVTALHRTTWPVLLPFPPLRMGWGLDAHWSALATQHGWRIGVVDATPIAHLLSPAADAYSREGAIREARDFLAERPYLPVSESQRTLSVHRRCA